MFLTVDFLARLVSTVLVANVLPKDADEDSSVDAAMEEGSCPKTNFLPSVLFPVLDFGSTSNNFERPEFFS